jgi:crotonobetainyl-CoA:carnitine CoA-transferase CaiB-like acyl-CoA transferase
MPSFEGLRVLEFSGRVAGATCGKLLAGFGADVIRVPGGQTPVLDEDERTWLHTAKREVRLDPKDHLQRNLLETLVRNTDIVIDAWGIDVLAERGLDAQRLVQLNPRLVLCQITPFGQTGPRRGWQADDITLYAASGLMYATGDPAREPLHARPRVCELTAGLHAYVATLMALLRRARDGVGEVIDLSIQESAIANGESALNTFLATGEVAQRDADQGALVPWRTFPCADGQAAIIGAPVRNWLSAAKSIGIPALLEPWLGGMDGRVAHRAAFDGLIAPWLRTKSREELFHLGQRKGLAWAPIVQLQEAIADPHTIKRRFLVEIEQPGRGTLHLPGAPFRASCSLWRDAPAPPATLLPDQAAAIWSDAQPAGEADGSSSRNDAPLAGVRVIDFTHDGDVPLAARVLADYGAEVVKIEYPKRLDGLRGTDITQIDAHPGFWMLHRGQKSLTLDLAIEEHRSVLDALVKTSDVILENSRPDVLARHGYGYERVRTLKPDIVFVSTSAFGANGPNAAYRAYGGTLEAASGMQSLTGYDADSPVYRVRELGVMIGAMAAGAVMTALVHRERTGDGQCIDLSQHEVAGWLIGEQLMRAARTGEQPALIGNRHTVHAPQGCYAAAGEDRWFVLSVRTDEQWRTFAQLIGREALANDPRFLTAWERRARHGMLDAIIGDWARRQEPELAVEAMQNLGIAAASVANAADLLSDPHLGERGWFQDVCGDRYPGFPFRLSHGGACITGRGPSLGSANAEFFERAGVGSLPDLTPDRLGTAFALL